MIAFGSRRELAVDHRMERPVRCRAGIQPHQAVELVTALIASLKTISEDGGFEMKNLIRDHEALPRSKLRAVIDRDLYHRPPGRIIPGDVIEFS